MKPQLNLKIYSLLAIFWFISAFASAQNYDASKSLSKNATVPGNVTIEISNQSGDIKINTASDKNVSMTTSVEIRGNSKEDVDKVIKAIEDFTFELRGNELEIDTRFYKNMNSVNNRRTITLLNGDKVRIGEFKIRHQLNIPRNASLKLNNKYSDIELQELDGDADFTLYSSNLHADDFAGDFTIEAKYSKIYVGEIQKDADIDFYDSDIEFTSCGDVEITSKYSKFEGKKTGKLVIDSYDDKFNIGQASNLNLNAKYSDFVSQADVNEIRLDIYDCNIRINSAKSGTYKGKYSELKLGNVKVFNVTECYDDDFYLGKTEDVQIDESKYCKFEIDEVSKFYLSGYDDIVNISRLKNDFSGIDITGKYGKVNVNAGSEPFQVACKIKYGKVDIPESVRITKQIKENSDLELVAGNSGGKISVEGYDIKVVIND
ncbi:hypothetical protein GM418_08590 [Maribellus comscasis]|uniref:Adhesin domain-containing protein n=1 Tax=Maribellus comscasis TaxID=2681766 RepID=A0A6I6JMR6_9BACT|nr:hypothetical protein [Maribellus comscasis]QGY43711.1 hypothetical protein GM418_08590 [Maribellus comscasis]